MVDSYSDKVEDGGSNPPRHTNVTVDTGGFCVDEVRKRIGIEMCEL